MIQIDPIISQYLNFINSEPLCPFCCEPLYRPNFENLIKCRNVDNCKHNFLISSGFLLKHTLLNNVSFYSCKEEVTFTFDMSVANNTIRIHRFFQLSYDSIEIVPNFNFLCQDTLFNKINMYSVFE
ncbi:MAG: hypothetical protein AABY22_32160 [Nanoarchaeota archaeon]